MASCSYIEYDSSPPVILVLGSSWTEPIHSLAATPWTVTTVKRESLSKKYNQHVAIKHVP